MLPLECLQFAVGLVSFNGHPPLGVNATELFARRDSEARGRFNGHPPLGVNATSLGCYCFLDVYFPFQWAPTLGGECYAWLRAIAEAECAEFQWAPTLGGECYKTDGGL